MDFVHNLYLKMYKKYKNLNDLFESKRLFDVFI